MIYYRLYINTQNQYEKIKMKKLSDEKLSELNKLESISKIRKVIKILRNKTFSLLLFKFYFSEIKI